MKLVLLAGGKGTRLYPLTENIPKPMLKINGKPMLEYQIEWAKKNGISEIIICSGYLSEQIEEYFGDGKKWGIDISYSVELEPLGTAGPLKLIEDSLDGDFILLNADILTNADIKKAFAFHQKKNAKCTLLTHTSSHPQDSDLVEFDESGKVLKLWNKPHQITPPTVFSQAGIYILHPQVLNFIERAEFT